MPLRFGVAGVLAGLCFLAVVGDAVRGGFGKSTVIDSKLGGMAKKIADLAHQRKEKAVALGPIAGPGDSPAGALLQSLLARRLAAFKIAIDKNADLLVRGKFDIKGDSSRREQLQVEVQLTITVRDHPEARAVQLAEVINQRGNDDLAALLGLTVDFHKREKGTPDDRNEWLGEQREKPQVVLEETKARTRKDSRFWVEVVVKGKPAKLTEQKGQAFLDLAEGDEFAVRLHNGMRSHAAALLLIDGVPTHQFEQPLDKAPDALLVEAGKTRQVEAWPLGGKKSERFRWGKLRDLPGAEFLRPNPRVGTITALFFPTWEDVPPPEFAGPRCGAGTPTYLDAEGKQGALRWWSGQLLEAVTLRYKKD